MSFHFSQRVHAPRPQSSYPTIIEVIHHYLAYGVPNSHIHPVFALIYSIELFIIWHIMEKTTQPSTKQQGKLTASDEAMEQRATVSVKSMSYKPVLTDMQFTVVNDISPSLEADSGPKFSSQDDDWEIVPTGMQDGGRFPQVKRSGEAPSETYKTIMHFDFTIGWGEWKHTLYSIRHSSPGDEPEQQLSEQGTKEKDRRL